MVSGVLAQVVADAGASASGCGNECEWLRVWVRGGITGEGCSGAALLEKDASPHYTKDENSHA